MGHHIVDKSTMVVALAAQMDLQQQQEDTPNQTGAAHQDRQDLQDRYRDCRKVPEDVLDSGCA